MNACEFGILGPLEARAGGRPLELPGRKARALLALLLVRANEVVATDVLAEALWPGGAPARALNAIQVHVSGLRKALGPDAADRLRTHGSGYVLAVEPGELDRDRFTALVADGRAALAADEAERAGETLREALALWRGQALADFLYEPFAQAEIARLEDLRLAALEERIEADLALARHGDLVGELEALVGEHPLRERLRGQHMLALYRSGRQAEALEAYQQARAVLVEELGIEPSPPLRALEAAILRHDASLDVPAAAAPRPAGEASAPAPAEVRKLVTVLSCDVAAAGLGERLDPEALRRVTARWFEAASATVARHEGTIESLAGDVVTAVFGVPRVHEDDALRAVRTAFELREALEPLADELERAWGAALAPRIGIETGEVLAAGGVGLEPAVVGDVVSVAGTLREAAPAGGMLVGEAAHRLVQREVDARAVEPVAREGRAPARAYAVVAIAPPRAAYPPPYATPMVGREAELARIAAAFDEAAAARACRMLTVLAPAGVGKSRLAAEAARSLAGRGTVVAGRCVPYGEEESFRLVLDLVRQAADASDRGDGDDLLVRVAGLLEGEEEADAVAGRLGELLGLREGTATSEETSWAVRRTLEAFARRRPLLVVLEDLHWAQPALLDLVEYVRDWAQDAPVLLLALARPELLELRPSWTRRPGDDLVFLEPLGEDESERLLAELVGAERLAAETRARIAEAAEGNPLFLEQLLAMVGERGGPADGSLAIPPTIHALLAARLDALPPGEREVMERAAVMGRTFSWEAVRELVAEQERRDVGERLSALVRKELLSPERPGAGPEHAFRFRHALIRDAAYAALPKEARGELHARYAAWLGERTGDHDETIGFHLEQAVRYRLELGLLDEDGRALAAAASARLAAVGRRALARGDVEAAARVLERSVSLAETGGEARADLLAELGVARRESGDLAGSEEALARAAEQARADGDERVRARVEIERSLLRHLVDPGLDVALLRETAEEAIPVFEASGDELGLARAWRHVAQAHWSLCQCAPMEEALERGLVHAELAGDEREVSDILNMLVRAVVLGPKPADEGLRRCRELRERARGDTALEAWIDGLVAVLAAMRGEQDEARRLYRSSIETIAERRLRMTLAGVHQYAGIAELVTGDPETAEEELRRGYDILDRMGERATLSTMAALLARALYLQERHGEAEELVAASREAAADDDLASQVMWRGVLARLLARRGDEAEAETLAREAVARIRTSDFVSIQADTLLDLADVLRLLDRPDEARPLLDEACRLYDAKGNAVAASAARALAA